MSDALVSLATRPNPIRVCENSFTELCCGCEGWCSTAADFPEGKLMIVAEPITFRINAMHVKSCASAHTDGIDRASDFLCFSRMRRIDNPYPSVPS